MCIQISIIKEKFWVTFQIFFFFLNNIDKRKDINLEKERQQKKKKGWGSMV